MKIRDRLPLLAVLCCFSALLLLPEVSAQAAQDAMLLCAQTLIPSLFPFFVLSSLLVQSDVPRLLSSRAGAALYLIHVAAALCAGLLICRALPPAPHGTYPHKSAKAQRFSTAFPTAVQNALTGCLNVSAFVVFFTVLARLLLHFLPEAFASSLPCALLLGFLELTSGVLALPCSRAGFLSCAALLGWGGLSVHCQTLSVLAASPLSARYYLKGKALQSLLSLLLALPALPFLFP